MAENAALAPPLEVNLLGPPELRWDGKPLLVPRRQARALLYRLAAAPQPSPRDYLGFLFWPDSPQMVARRNLTVLLAQLRRTLPLPHLLVTHGDSVGLQPASVAADTVIFAALAPNALQSERLNELAAAVNLYRGAFLDGFTLPSASEFEAWVDQERQSWERRYLDALSTLVTGYAASGNYAQAIEAAQHALATDELAEELHRRLIELYALCGERAAALRQYERCVIVLERDLGVEPLPETRAVYEAIRDGHYPLREQRLGADSLSSSAGSASRFLTAVLQPTAQPHAGQLSAVLPVAPGTLFGRADEVAAMVKLLRSGDGRLLTLTGPGGSGKTRLALEVLQQVAPDFAAGVVFVPLAPLRDPALVIDAIAQACGIEGSGAAPLIETVRAALVGRRVLLALDNFEHLLPAAAQLAELLRMLPELRLLVTSRSMLRLSGEQVFPLAPLPVPDLVELPSPEDLAKQPAVALLVARTRALNPSFALNAENAAALAAICVRLDGLPLALELAAARLRLVAPRALLKRLDHRLALLTQGPQDLPARQRTLREVIAWSYGLLDNAERALFERLAVFAGSWSFEAAEELGNLAGHTALLAPSGVLDGLSALVDASLVQQVAGTTGEPRFQLLETIREYAFERLEERGVAAAIADAHMRYYSVFAAETVPHLPTVDAPSWLARLADDHANLLAALERAAMMADRRALLQLFAAMVPFWYTRGQLHEGRYWIERALWTATDPGTTDADFDETERALLARTYLAVVNVYFLQGEYAAAISYAQASVELWRRLDNPDQLSIALIALGACHALAGDPATGMVPLVEGEALAEQANDAEARAWLALDRGRSARHRGRPYEARQWLNAAADYYRQEGNLWFLASLLLDLVPVLLTVGDEVVAEAHAAEALAIGRRLESQTMIANALNDLGEIARYCGRDREAETYYTESMQLLQRMGNRSELPRLLHNLAQVALRQGAVARAAELFVESLSLFAERQIERGVIEGLIGLASVATTQGQPLTAARLWGYAEALGAGEGWELWPPDQLAYAVALAQARAISDSAAFERAWQEGRGLAAAEARGLAERVGQDAYT